ncbi:MAG: PEP-CTERM sorting domain-containing protein [Planctomycetota bacterium]|jgi:hypothetical protein
MVDQENLIIPGSGHSAVPHAVLPSFRIFSADHGPGPGVMGVLDGDNHLLTTIPYAVVDTTLSFTATFGQLNEFDGEFNFHVEELPGGGAALLLFGTSNQFHAAPTQVPEPGTIALLAVVALACGVRLRRKRGSTDLNRYFAPHRLSRSHQCLRGLRGARLVR